MPRDAKLEKKPSRKKNRKGSIDEPASLSRAASAKMMASLPTPDRGHDADDDIDEKVIDMMTKTTKTWQVAPYEAQRFKSLSQNVQRATNIPEEVRTKEFNRHMDVIPHKNSHVKLPVVNGDVRTGYINANYIRNYLGQPRAYIATQAPLDNTTTNFWRMIWQEKVTVIVMVTNLIEKGNSKCVQYWPATPGAKIVAGDLTIKSISSSPSTGCMRSELIVTQGKQSIEVSHFWYNTWPDHGVPKSLDGTPDPSDILYTMRLVHETQVVRRSNAPIVVHCSAGVGRAGTVVAIDHCVQTLTKAGKVDPIAVVEAIRKDRVALVQHTSQFKLCHAACFIHAKLTGHVVEVSPAASAFSLHTQNDPLMQKVLLLKAAVGKPVIADGYGPGILRYFGPHKTKEGFRCGVELSKPIGMNNGTIGGHVYFSCAPNHGVLIVPTKVSIADGADVSVAASAQNTYEAVELDGEEAKPKPPAAVYGSMSATSASGQPLYGNDAAIKQQGQPGQPVYGDDAAINATGGQEVYANYAQGQGTVPTEEYSVFNSVPTAQDTPVYGDDELVPKPSTQVYGNQAAVDQNAAAKDAERLDAIRQANEKMDAAAKEAESRAAKEAKEEEAKRLVAQEQARLEQEEGKKKEREQQNRAQACKRLQEQMDRLNEKINDARRSQKNLELQIKVKAGELQRLQRQASQQESQYEAKTVSVREKFTQGRTSKIALMLNDAYGPFWESAHDKMGRPAHSLPKPQMQTVLKNQKSSKDDTLDTAVILSVFSLATYNK